MNMKKLFSILLAIVLLVGIIAPCFNVWGAELLGNDDTHTHTFGQWTFDTAKGSQSRTCSGCSEVQTLYGTTNKLSQVTTPAMGENYYLAANINGTLQYFYLNGSVAATNPYSLNTSDDIAKAKQVSLATAITAGHGEFQIEYDNNGTLSFIYCFDALKDSSTVTGQTGVQDTGTGAKFKADGSYGNNYTDTRSTFSMDQVNGIPVLRKYSNNNVLAVKELTHTNGTTKTYRMLGVPESELANADVYPVMLLVNHTHSYGTAYEKNETKHWQVCDCGATSAKVAHTYGDWIFDNVKGNQYKKCTVCEYVGQTLYGTTDKLGQVTTPAMGERYYLAADINGTLQYLYISGSVTATNPYSLNTTNVFANAKPVSLATAVTAGHGEFQIEFDNNGTLSFIYCFDSLTSGTNKDVQDTGTGKKFQDNGSLATNYSDNRATFSMDRVNGTTVLRKYSNNNVLVVKELTHVNGSTRTYRMLGVPEADLANANVYPVMLLAVHTHSYGAAYEKDASGHWQICDCGATSAKADHDFSSGSCVCGAENVAHECTNTDGKWYADGDKHYQKCGTCGEKINEAAHTYGSWIFDTTKGFQYKECTACEQVGETLYGTDAKVSQVMNPSVGSTYYMVANVGGALKYFATGKYTNTAPYSLPVVESVDTASPITLAATAAGTAGEFKLTFEGGKAIYCADMLNAGDGIMDTSATSVGNTNHDIPAKTTFIMDEVDGVKVIRKTENNNVLVLKRIPLGGENVWRMLGVPQAELANADVYPVMLAVSHTHSFGTAYEKNADSHWQVCACGTTSPKADHDYINGSCICGAAIVAHDCQSADGKWYAEGDKHYQVCGTCRERINEAAHTYGSWIFDTTKGFQYKECTACEQVGQTLHGTSAKVSQAMNPAVGSTYYMVANVGGDLKYFATGKYTNTAPYSLPVVESVDTASPITLAATAAGTAGEFKLTYEGGKAIYCADMLNAGDGIMDTSATSVGNTNHDIPAKTTFVMDEVDGVKVIRKTVNNNVLVLKKISLDGENVWRMLGVPESELANEDVYPVMLATVHEHDLSAGYQKDAQNHWYYCPTCDSKLDVQKHKYEKNSSGDRICACGQEVPVHTCQNVDGKWHADGDKHYQLCDICDERVNATKHTYGAWTFDTAKGNQSRQCSVCEYVEILHGNTDKGYQVLDAKIGQKYYLAANVDGTLQFFYQGGSTTNTSPYSLYVTENLARAQELALEDYMAVTSEANAGKGFQMTWPNPDTSSDSKTLRIYCYNAETTNPAMDTGHNGKNTANGHTFFLDEVNGVKVVRKYANNNVLVVKFDPMVDAYRMLGVPESELGQDGVYPAMLLTMHQHSHTDTTYQKDSLGHWFACECGGKSAYEEHTVTKWTYTKEPTQTTGGQKTGTCTTCGGKAVVDLPALVAEGHYYLTGKLDGKTYYFRPQGSGESVEDTVPFSLMSTTKEKEAMKVNVEWDEKRNTYVLNYTQTRTLNIYMADVNGNTVKQDGKVDLSASATTVEDRILFRWDSVNKRFYQIEGGERYVMAFKKMTLSNGKTAVRMLAVPESELSDTTVPVQLKTVHLHNISDKWQGDAVDHWMSCSCGIMENKGAHEVSKWTVEKKATTSAAGRKSGICSVCKQKVVNAIPMLTDKVKEPQNGGKYYLTGVLNGKLYYFRHTPSGGSVANTYPYSLYTDDGSVLATPVRVKVKSGNYNLSYSEGIHLYISGDGVGMTSKVENKNLVDFQWDKENKVLYQMEGDVKTVLVMMSMRTADGEKMLRITSMPLDRALIDPSVAIIRLTTEAPPEPSDLPEGATLLDYITDSDNSGEISNDQPGFLKKQSGDGSGLIKLLIAVAIVMIAVPLILIVLLIMKNGALGAGFFRRWNLWAGICIMAGGLLLVAAMILPGILGNDAPSLRQFTIVASDATMKHAETLSVEIYEDHGYRLPVVHCDDFEGDYGIYLDLTGFNSFGGYKYKITNEISENSASVYIDGSSYALDTAISKWVKSARKNASFPFGMEEELVGYEWNTGDVNMTGLGFGMTEMTSRELYEGVEMRELKYDSFAYGKHTGYAVIVDSDANVELKVSAGEWDENTTTDNPGEKFTVQQHGKRLTDAGYDVLAITNAGFYDLNTTMTYIPWGMQIVDGLVKKEPNKDNPKNTDNWFGQTADGKYVISNTDGYSDYETKISDGVGGGLLLMKDGKPCFSATTPDYRTVVGITTEGDLVMLTISGANYAVVVQAFMDMGLDMDCILNLDGGGSTTLHARTEEGKLEQYICETPVERAVADAIAIVKKK